MALPEIGVVVARDTGENMTPKLRIVAGFIAICLSLALPACSPNRIEEKSSEGVFVRGAPAVFIENFNGSVDVSVGAADKVQVEVTKYTQPETRDSLKQIRFAISQDSRTVNVKSQWLGGPSSPGNTGVDLKVSVPAGCVVQVVNGNGEITYHGALGSGENVFEAGNGAIELTLPVGAQFQLTAVVGNGSINSEFPFETGGEAAFNVVEGIVGSNPSVKIIATTGNGDIWLKRGD
jgi:hypothetical protein